MFSCKFCKIYQNSFFIEHLETAENILKSQAFYRSLLNRNVHQFIFIFFMEPFLSWVFKVFSLRSIASSWISQTVKIKPIAESFWVNRIFEIGSSRSTFNYSYSFRKQPATSVFRETWAITPTNLLKENLTY